MYRAASLGSDWDPDWVALSPARGRSPRREAPHAVCALLGTDALRAVDHLEDRLHLDVVAHAALHVVVQDALVRLRAMGTTYDAVCLLQPTNPLRAAEDIDAAISLLHRTGVDSVVSVAPIPPVHHPLWAYLGAPAGTIRLAVPAAGGAPIPRRQDLPPAFHREGALYVTRTKVVLEEGSLYGRRVVPYVMPPARSGGIDTPEDLRRLEEPLPRSPASGSRR